MILDRFIASIACAQYMVYRTPVRATRHEGSGFVGILATMPPPGPLAGVGTPGGYSVMSIKEEFCL